MDQKLAINSKSFENKIDHYPNGKVKRIRSGEFEQVFEEVTLQNGSEIIFFEAGTPSSIKNFTNGKLSGTCFEFYELGQLKETGFYDKSGTPYTRIMFYESGQKKHEEIHEVRIGVDELKYADDTEYKIIEYHINGKVSRVGRYSWYYDDARLAGKHRFYHENGNLKLICYYVGGVRAHVQLHFDISGKLTTFHVYEYSRDPGNHVDYYSYHFNDNEYSYRIVESSFYKAGKIKEIIKFNGNGDSWVIKYDDEGKVISKQHHDGFDPF